MKNYFMSHGRFAALCSAAVLSVSLVATQPTWAQAQYTVTKLIADTADAGAAHVDPNLINPWGISYAPTGPFWLSDAGTGVSTLNKGDGSANALIVTIPAPASAPVGTVSAPTGQVFIGGKGFHNGSDAVGTNSNFAFVTEDGTLASWAGANGTTAKTAFDNSATNASYKGLATASVSGSNFLYAADFHNGKIDVFNNSYSATTLAGDFSDNTLPAGYAPFNVQNIGGSIYVTYAKQDDTQFDSVAGAGFGFVNVFNADGTNGRRLASGTSVSALNAPWGLAQAPSAGFGIFNNAILVGNFGSGEIAGFQSDGTFLGTLTGTDGQSIKEDGLWGLTFGNGAQAGLTNYLYFTAGTGGEQHGLFGSIAAVVPEASTLPLMLLAFGGVSGSFLIARRRRTA